MLSVMHVALVAPPWYSVPPNGYGGIELVVSLLDRELRRRGHRVTLIAAEGSPHAVTCAPVGWHVHLGGPHQGIREATYAANVVRVLDGFGDVDVVHDHAGSATLLALSLTRRVPVMHTVHGPLGEAEHSMYASLDHSVGFTAISDNQRTMVRRLNWIGRVHNAVDLEALEVADPSEKEPYLLCLARICEDKGQHIALDVARRLGMRLVLAGKVEATPAGREYYRSVIAPRIDDDHVVHITNVAGVEKARLLARATALLAPLQWDEPFGLATVEAMASGTPAISTSRGAAPELIRHGVTGFLADDVDAMVAAVRDSAKIDPDECAWNARMRFSPEAMADGYLELYERVTAGEPAAVRTYA
jgi:glycosyltransferase involved in cell wall biosynthesis